MSCWVQLATLQLRRSLFHTRLTAPFPQLAPRTTPTGRQRSTTTKSSVRIWKRLDGRQLPNPSRHLPSSWAFDELVFGRRWDALDAGHEN